MDMVYRRYFLERVTGPSFTGMRQLIGCLLFFMLGPSYCQSYELVARGSLSVPSDSVRLARLLKRANALIASQPDSAATYAQQVLAAAGKDGYRRQQAQALEYLGWLRYAQGDYPAALQRYQQALVVARAVRFYKECAVLNDDIGKVLQEQGAFPEALDNFLSSLRYYTAAHDSTHWAYSILNVAAVEYNEHRYSQAIRYYQEGIRLLARTKSEEELTTSYQGLAMVYADIGRYDQAEEYFRRGLTIFRRKKDDINVAIALNNLGDVYERQKKYDLARRYYEEGLQLATHSHDQSMVAVCSAGLAQVLVYQAAFAAAETYAANSVAIARRINAQPVAKAAYLVLADAQAGQHQFEPALANYKKGKALEDSIYGSRHAAQLDVLRTQYQQYHHQQEEAGHRYRIQQLERDQHISHLMELLLGGFGLGLLGLGWLFWRQYQATRQRDEARRQAQQATDRVTQLMNQGALYEAKQELGLKNKKLASLALSVTQKGEFLHEIKQRLEVISRTANEEVRKQLVRLRQSIEQTGTSTNEWEQFRFMFEEVHQTFFSELQRRYPEITPNELRLAALLKLNFSSKAMAGLLGISEESIKKARYRLRQKLQLNSSDNLVEFMMRVDAPDEQKAEEAVI